MSGSELICVNRPATNPALMLLKQGHAMNIEEAIFSRRSAREFTAQTVDDRDIDQLIEAAVYAPNAMHQQPWAFIVLRDKKTIERNLARRQGSYADKYDTERTVGADRSASQRSEFRYFLWSPCADRCCSRCSRSLDC